MYFLDSFGQILGFGRKTCFLSFSRKNHADSSRQFVKNSVLDPQHTNFDQKSEIGHVRTCQDLSRRTSTYCKPADIFLFFRFYTFPFFISKFIMFFEHHRFYQANLTFFYKIICFTKRIYHFL